MKQRIAKLVFAVTLILLAGIAALGCLSFQWQFIFELDLRSGANALWVEKGFMGLDREPSTQSVPLSELFVPTDTWLQVNRVDEADDWLSARRHRLPGISYGIMPTSRPPASWWFFTAAYWPTLLLALAAIAQYRFLLRRHTPRPGFCPTCGYDLRATPDRCPECGHEVAAASKTEV